MSDSKKLREHFYGWQCRVRQQAVRKFDGRPSEGMRAQVVLDGVEVGALITGLVRRNASDMATEFSHIVRKTHDPNQRQQSAIKLLSSVYYQYPKEFKNYLTATFAADSAVANQLIDAGECELQFKQYQQRYTLHCAVVSFAEKKTEYQLTYWHNKMFNPAMPANIVVLGFKPDWKHCTADPPVA